MIKMAIDKSIADELKGPPEAVTCLGTSTGQTLPFVLKLVVILGVLALFAIELGSPWLTRTSLDNTLQNSMLDARSALLAGASVDTAYERIHPDLLQKDGITVTQFEVRKSGEDRYGVLYVTFRRKAWSLFLAKFMKDYFMVEVSAQNDLNRKY